MAGKLHRSKMHFCIFVRIIAAIIYDQHEQISIKCVSTAVSFLLLCSYISGFPFFLLGQNLPEDYLFIFELTLTFFLSPLSPMALSPSRLSRLRGKLFVSGSFNRMLLAVLLMKTPANGSNILPLYFQNRYSIFSRKSLLSFLYE